MEAREAAARLYAGATYAGTPPLGLRGWRGWVRLADVHDGDTLTAIVGGVLAGDRLARVPVRLVGIDAPELHDAPRGTAARDLLLAYLRDGDGDGTRALARAQAGRPLTRAQIVAGLDAQPTLAWLECGAGQDKYGRALGHVRRDPGDALSAADVLVREGLAVPYDGGARGQKET